MFWFFIPISCKLIDWHFWTTPCTGCSVCLPWTLWEQKSSIFSDCSIGTVSILGHSLWCAKPETERCMHPVFVFIFCNPTGLWSSFWTLKLKWVHQNLYFPKKHRNQIGFCIAQTPVQKSKNLVHTNRCTAIPLVSLGGKFDNKQLHFCSVPPFYEQMIMLNNGRWIIISQQAA